MSKKRSAFIVCLILVAAAVLFIIGSTGGPLIRVSNHGGMVRDVEISGAGFRLRLGDLGMGQSVSAAPTTMRGESDLKIAYLLNGKRVERDDFAYLESFDGYCADVVLNDEVVTADSRFLCFHWRRLVLPNPG